MHSAFYYELMSDIHYYLYDWNGARRYAEDGLEEVRTHRQRRYEGYLSLALGRVLAKADPPQVMQGEEFILQGIKILNDLEMRPDIACGYCFLGELYADTGQKEKALKTLRKAQSKFKDMGMDWWLARTEVVYSSLWKRAGSKTKARKYLQTAIDIFRKCEATGWVERYEKELAALQ